MHHQLLLAVLFILWPLGIWGDVVARDNHNLLSPQNECFTNSLWHPVLLHKLKYAECLVVGNSRTGTVVVQLGLHSDRSVCFQVVVHFSGAVQAENDKVTSGSVHGELEEQVTLLLCRKVPLSHGVHQELLHHLQRGPVILDGPHDVAKQFFQSLAARLSLGGILSTYLITFCLDKTYCMSTLALHADSCTGLYAFSRLSFLAMTTMGSPSSWVTIVVTCCRGLG